MNLRFDIHVCHINFGCMTRLANMDLIPRFTDAEHPTIIPMDASTSPTTPLGPMTRARGRALETEVTSLLSQLPFESHETWLLPQMGTLCILRYQGVSHEEAKEQGESEAKEMREE